MKNKSLISFSPLLITIISIMSFIQFITILKQKRLVETLILELIQKKLN